jgi:hypothetical protein
VSERPYTPVTTAFLSVASSAVEILGSRQVKELWNSESALRKFSVAGLAGHLSRGLKTVKEYLADPEPDGEVLSASEYFHRAKLNSDVDSDINTAIRERGEDAALGGPEAVAANAAELQKFLSEELALIPPTRRVRVAGGAVLQLEEYLRTRIVELVVHIDDLATSVDFPDLDLDPAAVAIAVDVVFGVSRLANGDMAVLRSLCRVERSSPETLRAF